MDMDIVTYMDYNINIIIYFYYCFYYFSNNTFYRVVKILKIKEIYDNINEDLVVLRESKEKNILNKAKRIKQKAIQDYLTSNERYDLDNYLKITRYNKIMENIKPRDGKKTIQTKFKS